MTIRLSPTEKRILSSLEVMDVPTVAKQLDITENTVYTYLKRIRKKYRDARSFVNLMDGSYRQKRGLRKYLYTKE